MLNEDDDYYILKGGIALLMLGIKVTTYHSSTFWSLPWVYFDSTMYVIVIMAIKNHGCVYFVLHK
jgi:hypothetical protein